MGANVTKKLRKKAAYCLNSCGQSQHKWAKNKSRFVDYHTIVGTVVAGDILEIMYGCVRHYVLLAKPPATADDESNHQYWCFHVQRLPDTDGYGVVRYEPLANALRDVFPADQPLYRLHNQKKLADRVLAMTENSMPHMDVLAPVLTRYQNRIVRFDDQYCNCEHYVTLWRYGIGWSNACNSVHKILDTVYVFRQSLAENILTESGVEISGECVRNRDCTLYIHCFGLYGRRLLDGIQYVMQRQQTIIKV